MDTEWRKSFGQISSVKYSSDSETLQSESFMSSTCFKDTNKRALISMLGGGWRAVANLRYCIHSAR